jgi:hypothetical protein
MIAASLVNENRWSFTLDSISKEFIGMGKNEKILTDAAKLGVLILKLRCGAYRHRWWVSMLNAMQK